MMNELKEENGTAVLFITHDLGVINQMAHRLVQYLHRGANLQPLGRSRGWGTAPGMASSRVGESGCGKSTLGRTVLQLYKQTYGRTTYYGRTLGDLAPKYMLDTVKNLPKLRTKWKELEAKKDQLDLLVDLLQLGGKGIYLPLVRAFSVLLGLLEEERGLVMVRLDVLPFHGQIHNLLGDVVVAFEQPQAVLSSEKGPFR